MSKQSRRQFLAKSTSIGIGTTIGLSHVNANQNSTFPAPGKGRKVIVAGAHPDDPETMCGGLMAIYSGLGYEVISAYLTRGEAGIRGKSHEEAAAIRTAEALAACKILQVRPEFLGQIDGSCEITPSRYTQILDFIQKEDPDILITHWPIDTHRDHRICSILVYDAWLATGQKSALYYGEVMTGEQSQNFEPTDYVDISSVVNQKHEACYAHKSQKVKESYADDHGRMEEFRGMEFGCNRAEAFIRHFRNPGFELTGPEPRRANDRAS